MFWVQALPSICTCVHHFVPIFPFWSANFSRNILLHQTLINKSIALRFCRFIKHISSFYHCVSVKRYPFLCLMVAQFFYVLYFLRPPELNLSWWILNKNCSDYELVETMNTQNTSSTLAWTTISRSPTHRHSYDCSLFLLCKELTSCRSACFWPLVFNHFNVTGPKWQSSNFWLKAGKLAKMTPSTICLHFL